MKLIGKNSRRFCALPPSLPDVELSKESLPHSVKNTRDHINISKPSGDYIDNDAAISLASNRNIY